MIMKIYVVVSIDGDYEDRHGGHANYGPSY